MRTSTYLVINPVLALLMFIVGLLGALDKIHFGLGMGDIAFIAGAQIIALISIVLTRMQTSSNLKSKTLPIIQLLVVGILLIYFIYSCTLGRGPESPWNGQIFF
jgi:hypothetical protein